MSDPWFLDPQNADARRTIDTRLTEDRSDNGATQQSQAAHRRADPIDAAPPDDPSGWTTRLSESVFHWGLDR